jgi:uncharacterized protein (DUF4415 family)
MSKRSASSARDGRAAVSALPTRQKIDFSDIPDSSPDQLRTMRRVGRPPLGERARQLIAIRVDADVLDAFRKEARKRKVGYQTLMNEILAQHARRDVA